VIQAEFIVSAISENDFPHEGLPEIVIAGRSNVGKSSLINRLAKNEKLARTSSTPGKTQTINFFRFNRSFLLVDLPGFGYARASKPARRQWSGLIEQYFRSRSAIVLVIHLVDSRMPPTDSDLQLAEWLGSMKIPRMIVATKSDKLSSSRKPLQASIISRKFGCQQVVMSSAKTGSECDKIWNRVLKAAAVVESSRFRI
jgi:GTP-binding protein